LRDGAEAAAADGDSAGGQAGAGEADAQLASAAEAEAEQADDGLPRVSPDWEYTDQLPNGKPGYILPEEDRSLSCVGIDVTGSCVGD
jgi:hypothetical protein